MSESEGPLPAQGAQVGTASAFMDLSPQGAQKGSPRGWEWKRLKDQESGRIGWRVHEVHGLPWRGETETVPSHTVARSIKLDPLWPNAYLFPHIFICQAPGLVITQRKGERKGEGKRKEKERAT